MNATNQKGEKITDIQMSFCCQDHAVNHSPEENDHGNDRRYPGFKEPHGHPDLINQYAHICGDYNTLHVDVEGMKNHPSSRHHRPWNHQC